jgi:hypothetical protein
MGRKLKAGSGKFGAKKRRESKNFDRSGKGVVSANHDNP